MSAEKIRCLDCEHFDHQGRLVYPDWMKTGAVKPIDYEVGYCLWPESNEARAPMPHWVIDLLDAFPAAGGGMRGEAEHRCAGFEQKDKDEE